MILKAAILGCLAYFGGGVLVHRVVLPEPGPEEWDHPQAGQVIENRFAGERIVIEQSRDDTDGQSVLLHLTLSPQGAVPAAHVHPNLDERFTVLSGTLMIRLGREDRILQAGEQLLVSRKTAHQPYNPFSEPAEVQVEIIPPGNMDVCLAQLHGYLGAGDKPRSGVRTALQMAVMARDCDLYLAGPPVFLQKAGIFLLSPTARLLGHHPFDPRYNAQTLPTHDHEVP